MGYYYEVFWWYGKDFEIGSILVFGVMATWGYMATWCNCLWVSYIMYRTQNYQFEFLYHFYIWRGLFWNSQCVMTQTKIKGPQVFYKIVGWFSSSLFIAPTPWLLVINRTGISLRGVINNLIGQCMFVWKVVIKIQSDLKHSSCNKMYYVW